MNSCENSNASTKLQGSLSSELWEESRNNIAKEEASEKTDKKNKIDKADCDSTLTSNDFGIPQSTLVICPRNSSFLGDHSFSRIKQRNNSSSTNRNEFRMARGNNNGERNRGNTRGRPFKKLHNDRDPNLDGGSHSSSKQKFQESLKNQDNCQNKYDDKRLNDESRVIKILRRLFREDDDHFLALSKQVFESLMLPENHRFMRRNLESICEYLNDALHSSPDIESQQQIIKCLAYIGYISNQEFKRYLEWIFGKYGSERKDDSKCLLLAALGETLKMDIGSSKLKDYFMATMSRLQSTLENVDRPELLVATVDVILIIIDTCPETFSNYFRDAVDILVGWHIDYTQPKSVISYASRSLQKLSNFWVADLQFTLTLLSQFLEDMESYDEELAQPSSGRSSPGEEPVPGPKECILRITSLISVFNTVVKSVADNLNPNVNPTVQWSFLTECLLKMLKTVMKAIEVDENRDGVNDVTNIKAADNINNWQDYVRSLKLSQKSLNNILKSVNQNTKNNQRSLTQLIKSLSVEKEKKDERKNACVDSNNTSIDQDKEEMLINILKSMEFKGKNCRNDDPSQEKEELIIVANECAFHLLSFLQTRITQNHDLLYEFIDLQLNKINIFMDETVISTLNIISKVIREVSANLPLELVHKLLGSESSLLKLRLRNSIAIQNAALSVYHSLLGLKNIPLLQEAYRYILSDLEIAYKLIISTSGEFVTKNPIDNMNYQLNNAELIIVFLLRALSDLANASNSIIGMWALKPSIFQLLAVQMQPYNIDLSRNNPLLQYSIIYLLYSHCSRYNHFVPSSSLITGSTLCRPIDIFPDALDVPTASPTSGHLSTILDLIGKCFEMNTTKQTLLLLCNWLQEIFVQAENYIGILKDTDKCKMIVSSLLARGATTNHQIALAVCKILELLISDKKVSWPEYIYVGIVDLSILHLTSFNDSLRENYGNLLMNIPVNIVLTRLNRHCLRTDTKQLRTIDDYSMESMIIAQRLHMRGNYSESHHNNPNNNINNNNNNNNNNNDNITTNTLIPRNKGKNNSCSTTFNNNNHPSNGEMQPQHFKTYMTYLLRDCDFDANCLLEIFTLCWSAVSQTKILGKMSEYGRTNRSFLYFWSGMEAAQHCVLNKLRTPLGKPQETFTTIEGALKTLARDISCKSEVVKHNDRGLDYSLHEHTRVRLFVEFLEHLERLIYNAAEGCAVALTSFPKPVRTFFHTNKSTCREWLNRIRLALCVVSLHAGLATNALRNGQRMLEDLSDADNTQGAEFERAVLCTAQALVMLGEAEALQGLYIYAKEREKKFLWLKAAVEDAAGRYESAAESYKLIIKEHPCTRAEELDSQVGGGELKMDGDSQVAAFVMQRLAKCYAAVGNWKQLECWKAREVEILKRESNMTLKKQMQINMNIQQVKCLKDFESGQLSTLDELSDWMLLDAKTTTNWSCSKTISECSNTLTNIALRLRIGDERHDFHERVECCKKVAAKTIEEGLRNMPSESLSDSILIQYSARGLGDLLTNKKTDAFELLRASKIKNLSSGCMNQILWWSEYFAAGSENKLSCPGHVSTLRLDVAKSARKEGNFKLAKRQIEKYFAAERLFRSDTITPSDYKFSEITSSIVDKPVEINWTKNNMRAFKEMSKLLYNMDLIEDAIRVCSVTALGISQAIVKTDELTSDEMRETGSKLILTLGKWIQQQEINVTSHYQLNQLLDFEALHNDGLMDKLFGQTTEIIPHSDMVIGKLMQLGVNQCPELASAWANFAGWCYKWGRKIVDNSNSGQLTDADVNNIRELLTDDISDADSSAILSILSQNKSISEDEGDIEPNDIKTSDMIENQLRQVSALSRASSQQLGMLVDIWRQAQKRIYSYYELAAKAYFKFLELASTESNDCATIAATLRLLRLIVKHALELQDVLETGLSTTPTRPWKEIIPQLFSRLSHPESYVRTRVSELLCRVAENSPHLITFPTVVGAVSDQRKNLEQLPAARYENSPAELDLDEDDTENTIQSTEINTHDDEHKSFMDACFAQLADCLSNGDRDSVNHVKILVKELRRITLLWDELWFSILCQHHSEFSKKFEQLEAEIQKVQDNVWLSSEEKEKLIAEKNRIILKPIVFVLENLWAITSVPPETPHEKLFQEKFGPCIEDVIAKLKNPKNPARPQFLMVSLKQLESRLAQKVNKRGTYTLSMKDISPVLSNMKDTRISMPGVFATDQGNIVTIKSVDNSVQILPTKTKPKKLMFNGSDGHVYTYLFKGLEDLHLDERIMQFLSICNTMMSKNSDTRKVYHARHYSVIPLGPRSGLIQWVDGVTPLFALYKRWQQRESAMVSARGAAAGNSAAVMRPSELFYNKLSPLLKERGIALENRKEWPASVLKQVLTELMAETPKDLLAKEIWCNSVNAGNWWQATKSYSYSVAVMSIIGYIIGLGDRHLDNVLVDLNTGEVVHIDYNVCFEKGKTLRVPEKVPFRMTPNIKAALGVTGVEGIFRLACEHTLRVMRRGRETLLTLLEAFVYDPLVDWRAGAENSIASYGTCQARARSTEIGKKQLEKELTHAMFTVRIAEMRSEWLVNRDLMMRALPLLTCQLSEWLETNDALRQCQDLLQERRQQLMLVREAQSIGRNHSLYSVIKRYTTFKKARDAHDKAKCGLTEKIEECEKQISMHNIALTTVRGPQLSRWLTEFGMPAASARDDHMVFDLVKEFLQNAGQNQMIVQCEQSENELSQLATQEALLIRNCLDLLSQYSAICSLYPLSTLAQHRSVVYHSWANKLLNTQTVDICHEIITQFEANYQSIAVNESRVQQVIAFSYQLQSILNDVNEKYKKYYERMVANEGLPDAHARIEQIHSDTIGQMQTFLRREKGADKALESVNINALCALNKRYLMIEGAAKCAGECLVDLTLREGDWFLDEMRLMSSLIVELTNFIPINLISKQNQKSENEVLISRAFECLKSVDSIYKGLQDLNYNFHMIILPEALKTIITEEPSVAMMMNEVDDIILTGERSLSEILGQLELHLRFTLMDMEGPHAIVQEIVANMRLRFEALLSRSIDVNQDSESLTPGQMLLMGFNGLFEKLQVEGNSLIAALATLDIPPCWKKIDQIREAKEIAVPIFHEGARKVLDDIFLIKRLQTISEFFSMCRGFGNSFKGVDGSITIYGDDRLNKPVKTFIADYVSRQLLGVTSQILAITLCLLLQHMGLNVTGEIEQRDIGAESKVSIEELCRKMVDTNLKTGVFTGSVLGQASALNNTFEGIWRRKQSARMSQQSVEIIRASLQRLQLQFTAHHWLHEDYILIARTSLATINPLNRPTFMLELRKTATALSSIQSRVCEAQDQQQNLVASVNQRLKWAAGANPALGEVMAAFDNAVLSSNEKLTRQQNLALIITSTCNAILHYEALRTKTSESITHDANFMTLLKQWEENCLLRSNLSVSVSLVEENLIEMLQLENNIDANCLRRAETLLTEAIVENQKNLQIKQDLHAIAYERLRDHVNELQSVLTEHHRLMTDVRSLLKIMLKQENIVGLEEFLTDYRTFVEGVSTLVKNLEVENLEPLGVIEAEGLLNTLSPKVPKLYDELLELSNESNINNVKQDGNSGVNKKRPKLLRQDTNVCFSPRKGLPLARDPTTGKAVQERNVYALNVWRRVRMKLEGRDPNPSKKYTTAEQVDYVIREAQNIDNLALLYEGWTPWV